MSKGSYLGGHTVIKVANNDMGKRKEHWRKKIEKAQAKFDAEWEKTMRRREELARLNRKTNRGSD